MKKKRGLHWAPDACAYNVLQFKDWMFSADRGERCLYHIGRMSVDQEEYPHLKSLGSYTVLMAEYDIIKINQSRAGPDIFQYYATRTDTPIRAVPRSVASCDIDVELFICLRGIFKGMETQSVHKRISASRIVRELLAGSNERSLEVVRDLVNAGYLEEDGRRVVVTDKGRGVLL